MHHRIYLCDPNKPNTKIIKRSPSAKTMVREGRREGEGVGSVDYGEGERGRDEEGEMEGEKGRGRGIEGKRGGREQGKVGSDYHGGEGRKRWKREGGDDEVSDALA